MRPMAISAALSRASTELGKAGCETPMLDARVLLGAVLGRDPSLVALAGDEIIDGEAVAAFASLVARRARHEPVAHITGRREFWSLSIAVTPDVLIPRPDSETLIETALTLVGDYSAPLRVLDLGTGSGCLLIALLSELPQATGLGIDVSPAAIEIARRNAAAHGQRGRAGFRVSDWFDNVVGQFDIIVANPPYLSLDELSGLDEDVRAYEPAVALVPGNGRSLDSLAAYRCIIAGLAARLAPKGLVLFEVGRGQAEDVARLLTQAGFSSRGTFLDLAGTVRVVAAG